MKAALSGVILACLTGCAVTHPATYGPDPNVLMVDSATSMLGEPYRYGGSAPGGFDCSGLVAYAAHAAGISVPRTAQEQQHVGRAVARRKVRAGDLVFMRLSGKNLHVGIALDAEHFIHAPSARGRVRIDSLDARPYAAAYLTARRIAVAARTAALH